MRTSALFGASSSNSWTRKAVFGASKTAAWIFINCSCAIRSLLLNTMLWRGWPSLSLGVLLLAGCFTEKPTVIYATVAPPPRYHIHLPGIGGYRSIDRGMLRGLQE